MTNARVVRCRDCNDDITFLRPSSPTAKAIPIDTGGAEEYRGTDRPVHVDPIAKRVRLATVDRGGFDWWLITAEQARSLGIGFAMVEAYSVHVCREPQRQG
jgi:hypothetical protein